MHMQLTREEVQNIATLCRIGMTEQEISTMSDELSHILGLFQNLQELDTEAVLPTGHSASLETVMREDTTRPSSSTGDTLANAPLAEGDLFRVNVVLEE